MVARSPAIDRLVVLAYISAVSMPPIGFVLALVIALRGLRKHALLVLVLGLAACAMWAVIIASGALTATDNSF